MVGEEVITEVANAVPDLVQPIGTLITVLQVIGGIIGVYLIFWLINAFINARRIKILTNLLNELKTVNKNLEKLIKKGRI